MKIEQNITYPKVDLDDFTPSEQKMMMLMSAVQGNYKTDYAGIEKAITVRLNCKNAPRIEALAELSNLSKNILINDLVELACEALIENLNEEDAELFVNKSNEKLSQWLSMYVPSEDL